MIDCSGRLGRLSRAPPPIVPRSVREHVAPTVADRQVGLRERRWPTPSRARMVATSVPCGIVISPDCGPDK
jgi:hypothetical protein